MFFTVDLPAWEYDVGDHDDASCDTCIIVVRMYVRTYNICAGCGWGRRDYQGKGTLR